jgi:DNA-binding HxlR family transcriptional regulator
LAGTKRFSELKKSLDGISQKVLTQHLRIMEENGLVNRKVYAEVPPRVEYSLTESGQSLKSIHDAMWTWGEAYKEKLNIINNEKGEILLWNTEHSAEQA